MNRIFVLAPTFQQAAYWLREFGTDPRDRRVIFVPVERGLRPPFTDPLPTVVRGMRWREGDEFLVVGDPDRIDWRSARIVVQFVGVPEDIVDQELEASVG